MPIPLKMKIVPLLPNVAQEEVEVVHVVEALDPCLTLRGVGSTLLCNKGEGLTQNLSDGDLIP